MIKANVYRYDDIGAPPFPRTVNCVNNIFLSCLVTGYGEKDSAGWTNPYNSVDNNIRIYKPSSNEKVDYYLKIEADTGRRLNAVVMTDVTDISTGNVKLNLRTPYKYSNGVISKKWIMVATDRSFWFFTEQSYSDTLGFSGSYFFVGDIESKTKNAILLAHSGGNYNDGDMIGFNSITSSKVLENFCDSKILYENIVYDKAEYIIPYGIGNETIPCDVTTFCYVAHDRNLFKIPGILSSFEYKVINNYETIVIDNKLCISHNVGDTRYNNSRTLYVITDWW